MNLDELSWKFMDVISQSMQSLRVEIRDCAKSEFTTPQFRVLVHLYKQGQKNRLVSSVELANRIGVSAPAMSRMIAGLVDRGFILRAPSKEDRRHIFLSLSAEGRRKVAALRSTTQKRMREKIEGLAADQRDTLVRGLNVLEQISGGKH